MRLAPTGDCSTSSAPAFCPTKRAEAGSDDEFWYFGEEVESYCKVLRRIFDPAHLAAVEET